MTDMIVDASVSASWLLGDEDDARADRALDALSEQPGIAPRLWLYEMRNILLVACRRERIDETGMWARMSALADLPIGIDDDADLDTAFELARRHDLSYYDALYLELAQRRRATLATLDSRLASAAVAEGVATLSD